MSVSTKSMKKRKKVGRPPGRSGRPLQMRVTAEFLGQVDELRAASDVSNRSEVIRRAVEQAVVALRRWQ
jgi:hypothetical protein